MNETPKIILHSDISTVDSANLNIEETIYLKNHDRNPDESISVFNTEDNRQGNQLTNQDIFHVSKGGMNGSGTTPVQFEIHPSVLFSATPYSTQGSLTTTVPQPRIAVSSFLYILL